MRIEDLCDRGTAIIKCADYRQAKQDFSGWRAEVKRAAAEKGLSLAQRQMLDVKIHYSDNDYSPIDSKRSLDRAVGETIEILKMWENTYDNEIPEETALCIVRRILSNFYMHLKAMYQDDVHKSGTFKKSVLETVKIGNEYDVQRVLRALLLPVFPTARAEVNSDNGCGGMRADLYLDEYDLAVEVKCTRGSMTQKQLTEQLGADAFLYPHRTVFMFIYDKGGIIANPAAYINAFKRDCEHHGKQIEVFIVQQVNL